MEKERYSFCIGRRQEEECLEETARALEKRTEMLSRSEYPGMWKVTDAVSGHAGKHPKKPRRRARGWTFLAAGLLFILTALIPPEKIWAMLAAGVISAVWGIAVLCGKGDAKADAKPRIGRQFRDAAQTLLRDTALKEDESVEILFDGDGMTMTAADSAEHIAYSTFECAVETEHLYLICADKRALVLAKNEMADGTPQEFSAFLAEKTAFYTV